METSRKKNKTQIKVVLGFGVAILIVSIGAVLNFSSLNRLTGALDVLSKPDEKLVCTRQLQIELSEVESNMRAYTLTHEEKYLDSFKIISDSIHHEVARLKFLTNDNDAQFALADTISHFVAAREGVLNSFIEKRKDGFNNKLEYSPAYYSLNDYNMLQSTVTVDSLDKINNSLKEINKPQQNQKNKGALSWIKNIFTSDNSKTGSTIVTSSENNISSSTKNQTSASASKKKLSVLDVNQILEQQHEILKKELQVWGLDELVLLQEDKNLMDRIRTAINALDENEMAIVKAQADDANNSAGKASNIIAIIGVLAIITTLIFVYMIISDIARSNELSIELEAQRKKAEDLAEVKEKFLANMSHEIRTPLNAIIGFTEQLSKEKASEKQKKYIDAIEHSSDHLLSIVNQILDFSRIESGKMQNSAVAFSIREVVMEIFESFKKKAAEKNLWFTYKVKEDVPEFVTGDIVSVKQVLLNLVGNAIKFTEAGSVDINCGVLIEYGDLSYLKIEVRDTGEGIPTEMQEKIFEEFTQADADITRRYGGTGLGLAISKKLVVLLNGQLNLSSVTGEGSVFTIVIPLLNAVAPEISAVPKIPATKLEMLRNKTVLLVDDESMNLLLGKIILDNWGLKVVTARSGKEALEKYGEQNFDIIILDIQMPEMSGIELAQKIRETESGIENKHSPILALTANLYHEQLNNPTEAGFDDVLIKPFKERDLFEKMNQLLIHSSNEKIITSVTPHENISLKQNPTDALYSLNYLNKTSGSNPEFILNMIHSFILNNKSNLEKLNEALTKKDWETIMRLAHRMIPSYNYLEINKLIPELKLLKHYADENETFEKIAPIINNISTVTLEVMKELEIEGEKLKQQIGKLNPAEII